MEKLIEIWSFELPQLFVISKSKCKKEKTTPKKKNQKK